MSRGSGAVGDRGRVANGDINDDAAAGGRVDTQIGTEVSFTELAGAVRCPGCDGLGPVGGSGGSGAATAAVPFTPAVGGMNNIKLTKVVRGGEGDPIERANSGLGLDTMGGVAPQELEQEVPNQVVALYLVPLIGSAVQSVEGVVPRIQLHSAATLDDTSHTADVKRPRGE